MDVIIFTTAFVLILAFSYFLKLAKDRNLPPGPWKLPVIGSMHHLNRTLAPYHSLRDLAKKYGPIMHLQVGEISTFIITSPDLAKEVLRTNDSVLANRPKLSAPTIVVYNHKDISFSPHGEYWRQMRKLVNMELLNVTQVGSFRDIREEESWIVTETIMSHVGKVLNLSKLVASMTNAIICRTAVGLKVDEKHELIRLIEENATLAGGFDVGDVFPSYKPLHYLSGMRPKLESIHRRIDKVLNDIVASHLEELEKIRSGKAVAGKEDLVHILLKLKENDGLGFPIQMDHIKAVILDLMIAGTQTSSAVLEWTLSELLLNPNVLKKATEEVRRVLHGKKKINEADIQELVYLKNVVKETLRLHPPVPLLLPREAMADTEIGGYRVTRGTKVIINAWAIARDPKYWANPDSFVPERFENNPVDYKGNDFEYIPFGAGRRICAGMKFGIPNIELPLAQILYHFNWSLPKGMKPSDLNMYETFGATGKRKINLLVEPECEFPFDPSC